MATFIIIILFSHQLSIVDCGRYQNLWAQLNVFTIIASIGIPLLTLGYTRQKIVGLFKKITKTQYIYYFIFVACCGLVFAAIQYNNIHHWYLIIAFLVAFTLSNISDAFLIVYRQLKSLAIINIIYAILYFGIHIYFLEKKCSLDTLLILWIGILLLKLLVCSLLLFNANKCEQSETTYDFVSVKNLWKQLYLSSIIQVSFLWIDKFIISILMSEEQSAIYMNGSMNIPFLPIIFSAVTNSSLLLLSNTESKSVQYTISKNAGRILSSVAIPLFIFLLFFAKDVVTFVFSDKYINSVPIFLATILVLPIRSYDFSSILQKNEKGAVLTKGAVIDLLLAIALMYPMYLLLGLPGVALCFTISTLFQAIYYSYHMANVLQVGIIDLFPWKNWILKIIVFTVLCALFYYLLPDSFLNFPKVIIAGCVVVVLIGITIFFEFTNFKRLS